VGTTTSALLHYLLAEQDAQEAARLGALKGLGLDIGALTGYVGGSLAGGVASMNAPRPPGDPLESFNEFRDRTVRGGYIGGGAGGLAGGLGGYLLASKLLEG